MPLRVLSRRTDDVDSITTLTEEIKHVATTVAIVHGLRLDWLNDDTIPLVPPHLPSVTETIYEGTRLRVVQPDAPYLLAMKILAGRPVDIDDAVALMEETGVTSVSGLCSLVKEVYGTEETRPGTSVRENAAEAVEAYNRSRRRSGVWWRGSQ